MSGKMRLMFLCTGNAARSQMAEGLARAWYGERFEVVSSGSRPAGWVHPLAIQALAEIGIDITGQTSKGAAAFLEETFDIVVTLCDSAAQDCPHWPNARRIEHWSIEDPSWGIDDPVTRPHRFAETRDEIGRRIEELAGRLS